MFLGHLAIGFGAKRLAPRLSLGTLILGCQLADLIWPVLILIGIERAEVRPGITTVTPLEFLHYPWSHSLLMLVFWGIALGVVWAAVRRGSVRDGAVLAIVVVSHWFLDALTHRPDLPLTPWGEVKVGLGLWSSFAGTIAVELVLFAIGVEIYRRSTVPRDRTGTWSLAALVLFLLVVFAANLFGPPPPEIVAVAWVAQAIWLLVAWGYWIDRHRMPRDDLRRV
ncbi:MAG TPA: metal-dependent hydrolase [Thermoanaerobaculia bacterium]|nr:metal-dependent hydrolase [Thermoanaerobaculia bacterium]